MTMVNAATRIARKENPPFQSVWMPVESQFSRYAPRSETLIRCARLAGMSSSRVVTARARGKSTPPRMLRVRTLAHCAHCATWPGAMAGNHWASPQSGQAMRSDRLRSDI